MSGPLLYPPCSPPRSYACVQGESSGQRSPPIPAEFDPQQNSGLRSRLRPEYGVGLRADVISARQRGFLKEGSLTLLLRGFLFGPEYVANLWELHIFQIGNVIEAAIDRRHLVRRQL